MKIVAGSLGGRTIIMPNTHRTRPVTEMVRAAIFNVISYRLESSHILDLYAGSGALGFEALSRGAQHATLVDIGGIAITTIKSNANELDVLGQTSIIKSDVTSFLSKSIVRYDIIFLDPPYIDLTENLVYQCEKHLNKDGILIVSGSNKTILSDTIGSLKRSKESTYGDSKISYYAI